MLYNHLQINKKFYDLRINRFEIEGYGEVEIKGEKLCNYRRKIQVKNPNYQPDNPYRIVLFYKLEILP